MRMVTDTHGSSAHGQTARLDPRAAESDGVGGAELFAQLWDRPGPAREVRSQPCGANPVGRGCQELPAFHRASTEFFSYVDPCKRKSSTAGSILPLRSSRAQHW